MARLPLLCFDIDGTLVRTRGAGREALDEAFLGVFGWSDATDGVHIAGSTDDVICRDVGRRFGHSWTAEDVAPLRGAYLAALRARLADPARTERLPGLPALLHALEGRAHLCLLTGNWRTGAELKLAAAGLDGAFTWGAFSEDAPDRDGLVPVARSRAGERGLEVGRVIVLGDTVADVRCARAGDAAAIVVETGFSTPAELQAQGPELQVRDFAQGAEAVLGFVAAAT